MQINDKILIVCFFVLCSFVLAAPVNTTFDPQKHGFRFDNTFKNDFIREFDIRTGGLCGGMVYAALDYYNKKKPISTQTYRPAVNAPLHDYIYNRQVHSLTQNLDKWGEVGLNPLGARNSEFFRWGLQGFGGGRLQELREKIDKGIPVPLGLQEYGHGGPGNHQVLAIGYDVGRYKGDLKQYQEDLKIFIYDPNFNRQIKTLIPDPKKESYYYKENPDKRWRTYFVDKKYSAHDPIIVPSIPIGKDGLTRELLLEITTGGDDLRGGNDNVHATVYFRDGSSQQFLNINGQRRWIDNYSQTVSLALKKPTAPRDIEKLVLTTTFSGGIGGDNWNIDCVKVIAQLEVSQVLYNKTGRPLFRFTGDQKNFAVNLK